MEARLRARGPAPPSPVHIVVAMQVQDATGHLAGHALQGQGVGRHGLGHPTAPQVALEVPLSRRAAPSPASGERLPAPQALPPQQGPWETWHPANSAGLLLPSEAPVSAPQRPAVSRMILQAADTFPKLTPGLRASRATSHLQTPGARCSPPLGWWAADRSYRRCWLRATSDRAQSQ